MSVVNIVNVHVLDNPTRFTNPFQFEITFECTSALQDDLEFRVVYVGSAEDAAHDQVLDAIMVGPVPVGVNKFVFQAEAPRLELIPAGDVTGVTVVLITCAYRGQEFVRVGYYVSNELEPLPLPPGAEAPPIPTAMTPDVVARLVRNILADRPRITRFPIRWDALDELEAPAAPAAAGELLEQPDDEHVSSSLPEDDDNLEELEEDDDEAEIDLEVESDATDGDQDDDEDRSDDEMGTDGDYAPGDAMVTDSPEHASIAPTDAKTAAHAFGAPQPLFRL